MVTSSFWLWAAQRSFYLTHVRVSTVRRATVEQRAFPWRRPDLTDAEARHVACKSVNAPLESKE